MEYEVTYAFVSEIKVVKSMELLENKYSSILAIIYL